MVQRVLACRNRRDIRIALYTAWGCICAIYVLCLLTGAVLYRYNSCCDPVQAGWLSSTDQMVPYLAVEIFQEWPGVAGMYIAGAYCGCLSTVSSGINSMATVIVADFIQPIVHNRFNEKSYLILGKILSVLLGLLCIAFAYIAADLGRNRPL